MTDHLVVYGDFNCPYSALASVRAGRIAAAGTAIVEWRAVEHDPDIPPEGRPVTGDLAVALARELGEVTALVTAADGLELRPPAVLANTALAVAAFAAASGTDADVLRRRLFQALWADAANIGDPAVLAALGADPTVDGSLARDWRRQWVATERHLVPMLVLADGRVSRGLGALSRLATIAAAG